jgi:hypothetical protein
VARVIQVTDLGHDFGGQAALLRGRGRRQIVSVPSVQCRAVDRVSTVWAVQGLSLDHELIQGGLESEGVTNKQHTCGPEALSGRAGP